jgi:hypothetical protein
MCEFVLVRRKRWMRYLTKEGGEKAMERRGSTFGAMCYQYIWRDLIIK